MKLQGAMRLCFLPLALGTLLAMATEGRAASLPVFATNFDAGAPAQFSGFTSTEGVQGFAGLGPAGNQFGGLFLRNDSAGNPATNSTLTLTGLPTHTSLDIDFLLGVIDSWDGQQAPDIFNVSLDGVTVFAKSFAIASGTTNYTPPAGGDIGGGAQQRGFNASWNDEAFNMYVDGADNSVLHNIAHTASTATIRWFASGAGWQGGIDESWAIDNVQIVANGVPAVPGATPEPGTLTLMATGLAGLAGTARRRRRSPAPH